ILTKINNVHEQRVRCRVIRMQAILSFKKLKGGWVKQIVLCCQVRKGAGRIGRKRPLYPNLSNLRSLELHNSHVDDRDTGIEGSNGNLWKGVDEKLTIGYIAIGNRQLCSIR